MGQARRIRAMATCVLFRRSTWALRVPLHRNVQRPSDAMLIESFWSRRTHRIRARQAGRIRHGRARYFSSLQTDTVDSVCSRRKTADKDWVDAVNVDRRKEGIDPITYEFFEIVMDRLEKEWFDLVSPALPRPPGQSIHDFSDEPWRHFRQSKYPNLQRLFRWKTRDVPYATTVNARIPMQSCFATGVTWLSIKVRASITPFLGLGLRENGQTATVYRISLKANGSVASVLCRPINRW
jgi:Enhancer of polycomb-like